jgi:hypothetical protein
MFTISVLGLGGSARNGMALVTPTLMAVVVLVLGGLGVRAQAQPMQYFVEEWADESRTTSIARPVSAAEFFGVDTATVSTNYDNWSDRGFGGRSEVISPVRIRGDEIGDDLVLQGNTGGRLTASGESIYNFSTTENITAFSRVLRWYAADGTLLREHQLRITIGGGAIFAGTGALVRQSDGFWDFLNLSLPNQIFASVRYFQPQGATVDDFGVYLAGPPTVSTSTPLYRNFTTGQNFNSGSADVNLSWYIRTQVIPTPASGVAGLGLICLISRRRTRTVG